jgi:putative transposon-encoded protein
MVIPMVNDQNNVIKAGSSAPEYNISESHKKKPSNYSTSIDVQINQLFTREIKQCGNSAHVQIDKKYLGKKAIILIPNSNLLEVTFNKISNNLPKNICDKCGKRIKIAIHPSIRSNFKESDFCHCEEV